MDFYKVSFIIFLLVISAFVGFSVFEKHLTRNIYTRLVYEATCEETYFK